MSKCMIPRVIWPAAYEFDYGVRTFFRAVVPAGIDNVCSSAKVVEEEFYDLAGRKVAGNTSGIYICRSRLSDGSVEVKKIKK